MTNQNAFRSTSHLVEYAVIDLMTSCHSVIRSTSQNDLDSILLYFGRYSIVHFFGSSFVEPRKGLSDLIKRCHNQG